MLISKQTSGLFLLFSYNRIRCYCGMLHNHKIDLCETHYDKSIFFDSTNFSLYDNILTHYQKPIIILTH